jgi:diguanylate cyclase (GGDEF)-like protein
MSQIPVLFAIAAGLIAGTALNLVPLLRTRHALRASRRALHIALCDLEEVEFELDQARYDATHDELTDLPNRRALTEHLAEALDAEEQITLALIDLNDFKAVNDGYGHFAGDALLREVADRLRGLPAPVRHTARLGGDEFVLVIDGDGSAGVQATTAALHTITDTPVELLGELVTVTGSAGVAAAWPGISHGQLLHDADIAMFDAKRAGGGILLHPGSGTRSVGYRPRSRHRDQQRRDSTNHHP